jgi:nucleoside 2-deoxyribosyltransferase
MIVVGGTYREICREPATDNLYGSGLRAAFAISRGCKQLEFISIVDHAEKKEVEALASSFGFTVKLRERTYPIQFHYEVPISPPRIISPNPIIMTPEKIVCSGEAMLVFGILEAASNIRAERLVLDPQGLRPLTEQVTWSANHVAIVGNKSEIRRMSTGNAELSIEQHAEKVREKFKADVVVVKCGALGAVVVDSSEVSRIGVFPTTKVNPLGSGDVFSAVFAYFWAERGNSASEAARLASKATAAWVSREPFQVINNEGNVVSPDGSSEIYGESTSVYIAAPFFTVAERWLVELCRTALMDLGARVFSPLHDVGWGTPEFVAPADLAGLKHADSVLALLDGLDSGTVYEIGYATALGIPVVSLVSDRRSIDLTMIVGNGARIYDEPSSAVYNAIWQGIRRVHSRIVS